MYIQLNLSYYAGIMFNAFKDLLCSTSWINSSLALCRMTRLKSYEVLVKSMYGEITDYSNFKTCVQFLGVGDPFMYLN